MSKKSQGALYRERERAKERDVHSIYRFLFNRSISNTNSLILSDNAAIASDLL